MKTVTKYWKGLPFAAALAFASAAFAQEAPSALPPADTAELLSAEEMETLAGGTGVSDVNVVTLTEQSLNAVNANNRVIGETVTSGQVNIGANAFSGYSGIGNFVINSGHNNNLQSSMNVSIVLAPVTTP